MSLRKIASDKEERSFAVAHNLERIQLDKRHALDQLERKEKEVEDFRSKFSHFRIELAL